MATFSSKSATSETLVGSGEMASMMRALDWSKTPVGPVESWPQSLRTSVGIILESKFGMMIAWGPELTHFYNDAYRPILGATKHPSLGLGVREVFPEIWATIGPLFDTVMNGSAVAFENLMVPLDRHGFLEECYFTFCYSPIRDESGGVGGILVTVSETSGHVVGQRRLKSLRDLAAQAGEVKEEQTAWQEAARVLGESVADVPFAFLYRVDPTKSSPTLAAVAGADLAVDGAQLSSATWPWVDQAETLVSDVRSHLGSALPKAWEASPRSALVLPISRGGRTLGYLVAGLSRQRQLDADYRAFLQLVSDSVATAVGNARAHQEERERADALASIDRAKTAFFSNVSHDFRTPLTLMLGPLEESLEDHHSPLSPVQRARQELIHRNGQRLLKLVNALLDFSRIEAGRVQASFRATDLSHFTRELASNFQSLIEKAGLAFELSFPAFAQPLYVDHDLWEKVVLNLISNAFKFTLRGKVEVSLWAEDERAVFRVKDTGIGIPAPELPHLFERFHRVEGAGGRNYEGSGIGLALVQELVKLHGGDIRVDSELGQGSCFTVSLPFGKAHLPPENVAEDNVTVDRQAGPSVASFVEEAVGWLGGRDVSYAEPEHSSGAALGHAHILLVDDNADMRNYIRTLVLAKGWTVDAVSSGEAALSQLQVRLPDLVLTDVMMQGMDGFELMRALRSADATKNIPCVLVSARAGEEAKVEALEAGADDYLVKPFSAKELVSRIASRLEVSRAHAEARASRERLHAQLMQAPVPISVVGGEQLVYSLANPLYLQMVGRTAEQVLGKPFREVFSELADDAPVFQVLENIWRSGTPFTANEYRVPIDRGRGKAEDVFFLFTSQPIFGADGKVAEIMTVAVDVTAQVVARQRVEGLIGELQLADQRKDEFLAMLAHELRNPMAAISVALAMLDRAEGDSQRSTRYRATAKRQMTNLVRLVDDLLDVSRITRGVVELRKEELDFGSVVANALAAARAGIESRQHALTVSLSAGTFMMQADATRLEQVVANLLNNAIKYTEPGGTISVQLATENADGAEQAVLRIRDTGRGIPPDMLERVFEMFVQVDHTLDRRTGGLGIGLTLVRRLVAMHGGSVRALSEGPGKGTEMVVSLPLLGAETGADGTRASTGVRRANGGKRRIVLVEDSEDIRETLKELLETMGHEVMVAATGPEGIDQILRWRPDVAFVDIGIPVLDGYEVARRVRQELRGHALRLVALTGYGGPEARTEAARAGFDLHLTKPVDLQELPRVFDSGGA